MQGENISEAVSQLRRAYQQLVISENFLNDISDCLINVFHNTFG